MIASKPGYKDTTIPVTTHVQGSGGAAYDHTPNPVVLALEPEAPAPAVGPVRERKRGAHPKVAAVDATPKG